MAGPCADPGRTAGFFAFLLLAILSLGSWELFAAAGWIWSTAVLILISWAVTGACLDSGLARGLLVRGAGIIYCTRTGEGTYSTSYS